MPRQRGFGGEMGRDWGGRRAPNPDNCPKVSGQDVRKRAEEIGLESKRDGLGMWFFKRGGEWYTLGQTNFLALNYLDHMDECALWERASYDR